MLPPCAALDGAHLVGLAEHAARNRPKDEQELDLPARAAYRSVLGQTIQAPKPIRKVLSQRTPQRRGDDEVMAELMHEHNHRQGHNEADQSERYAHQVLKHL